MSPTAAFVAIVVVALNLFAAGLALQSSLADGISASAGSAAERVASAASHR